MARSRPDVLALDAAIPTSSFRSGHTGAAAALYGSLAIVLLRCRAPAGARSTAVRAAGVALLLTAEMAQPLAAVLDRDPAPGPPGPALSLPR